MSFVELLPGIIWSGFLGLTIGNFATNPIYRLPRNESLFRKDPYCGDCNAKLMPRDLFPVFSWLMTRGKCRYCGAKVPGAYAVTEAVIGLLFIICYLQFGFSEQFLLVSLGITSFVMLGMMLLLDNFFSNKTLIACVILGMVYRTLQDGSIYGFIGTAYMGLLAGLVAWKISGKPLIRDAAAFPVYLKLLTVAGIWLAPVRLCVLLTAVLIILPYSKGKPWLTEWTIIVSIIILIIYSQVTLIL